MILFVRLFKTSFISFIRIPRVWLCYLYSINSQTPGCCTRLRYSFRVESRKILFDISLLLIFAKSVVLGAGVAHLEVIENTKNQIFLGFGIFLDFFFQCFNAEFHAHSRKQNLVKIC